MTLEAIKSAVRCGQVVKWHNYTVVEGKGGFLIKAPSGHCISLTWRDGVTLNGKPEDFSVQEN